MGTLVIGVDVGELVEGIIVGEVVVGSEGIIVEGDSVGSKV